MAATTVTTAITITITITRTINSLRDHRESITVIWSIKPTVKPMDTILKTISKTTTQRITSSNQKESSPHQVRTDLTHSQTYQRERQRQISPNSQLNWISTSISNRSQNSIKSSWEGIGLQGVAEMLVNKRERELYKAMD
ncbi:hypothetical protein PPACK8108_LOCUS13649 [Phakopsora pachyrhizi]|uniref:Uncharacterized protein n=1 Tax=Phakopsora pachyrhizi TaxID=170000 RepID=A0AAV0B3R4_PHAPC|nr:hypothetical protein PPACK8108_LOCUS13649 [Phakopsora pachyrhizi]